MICSSMLTELAWVKMKLRTKLVLESPHRQQLSRAAFQRSPRSLSSQAFGIGLTRSSQSRFLRVPDGVRNEFTQQVRLSLWSLV